MQNYGNLEDEGSLLRRKKNYLSGSTSSGFEELADGLFN